MRVRPFVSLLAFLLCAVVLNSQTHPIHLRSRVVQGQDPAAPMPRQVNGSNQQYRLLQFEGEVPAQEELSRRGIRILGRVPEKTFAVSAPAAESFEGLGVSWTGVLEASDKISAAAAAAVSPEEEQFLVFEFWPGVDPALARGLLQSASVPVLDHPDLAPNQLLGFATRVKALDIAADPSVAFIFPASEELVAGLPVRPCHSAMIEPGAPAPLAAGIGYGWDGAGRNAVSLTYSFGPMSGQLGTDEVRGLVQRALAEWSRYARLTFTESPNRYASRNIDILFGHGSHGDPYPFDGRGGVLAHTFYPAPPNSEPLAGDLHLDADEDWANPTSVDLYSVILHELGHALGLGHSGDPNSVMYAFYRPATQLTRDDILSLQQLYAPVEGTDASIPLEVTIDTPAAPPAGSTTLTLNGQVVGGLDPVNLSWFTDAGAFGVTRGSRSWTIPAVPINTGSNRITVTAMDGTGSRASRSITVDPQQLPATSTTSGPLIQFLEPASASLTVNTANLRVRGTANHATGILSVMWRNLRSGALGQASGTSTWDAGQIALQPGVNEITVDARANDGSTSTRSISVTLPDPAVPATQPQQPAGPDTTPPSITITSPAIASFSTTASQIVISGTARDNVAVSSVRWSRGNNAGSATGTTSWTLTVPLFTGINNLIIRAFDPAGNSSWRTISVTRR